VVKAQKIYDDSLIANFPSGVVEKTVSEMVRYVSPASHIITEVGKVESGWRISWGRINKAPLFTVLTQSGDTLLYPREFGGSEYHFLFDRDTTLYRRSLGGSILYDRDDPEMARPYLEESESLR
jgi:hypothetical protein